MINKKYIFPLFLSFLCLNLFSQLNNDGYLTSDTIQLNEVIITEGSKEKITGILSGKITLHTDGLKSLPSIMGNVNMLKILELTPGVQTAGDGNSNLYVRGGDPGQNLLLFNNNTIYSSGHAIGFFPLFNTDHTSSVDLLKSGVNAQYGGFLSSVIMIKSKDAIPKKTSLTGSVGILSSQLTLETGFSDRFGIYVTGRASYLELLLKPFLSSMTSGESKTDIKSLGYDFYDLNVTLIGKINEKNRLKIDAFGGMDSLHIEEDNINVNGSLKWHSLALSATLDSELSEKASLQQTVLFNGYKNTLHTSQAEVYMKTLSSVEDIGYRNKFKFSLKGIPVESGLHYTYHNILPQRSSIQNSGTRIDKNELGRSKSHAAATFASARLYILPRLLLEPGVRYNYYNSKTNDEKAKNFNSIDFRFFSRYQLDDNKFFRFGYSHNNQYVVKITPSSLGLPTDFWVSVSDKIQPQRGDEISVGYYQSFSDQMFELSSDIYFRNMNNIMEFNMDPLSQSDDAELNDQIFTGKGKAYGIEIMLKKNAGKFTGWLSYSLGRSIRNFDEINNGKNFPAKYDRTHDFSFVGSYTFNEKWDISLVAVYATGNTYTQPSSWYFVNNMPVREYGSYNGARMPNYTRMDFSLNYWFKKDNGLNFSLYNMFAIRNPVYVFMAVKKDEETGKIYIDIKRKTLFTIMPSISWKFKF